MTQANPSLYVGGLGPETNEHALYEHFKEMGPILSVRVCIDAQDNRKSLGYGYVNFQNPADAENAVDRLNTTKLGSSYIRVLRVERDPSKRRSGQNNLVITHLPPTFDIPDLKELFGKYGTIGSLHIAKDENGASRGYGHVQFTTAEAAKNALEGANGSEINSTKIVVLPYNHNFQEEKKKNFTNLYVRDFASTVTEEALKEYMSKFGEVTSTAVRLNAENQSMRFGYCCFASHEEAAKAVEELNGKIIPELCEADVPVRIDRFVSKGERMRNREKRRQVRRAENAKFPSLYVKNFAEDTNEEVLRNLFGRFGEVVSVHIMRDRENPNVSRGFGFVAVQDHTVADRCITELSGSMELGKAPLYVANAMHRDARRAMIQQNMNQQRRMPPNAGMGGPMGGMNNMFPRPMNYAMQGPMNPMFNQPQMIPRQMQQPIRQPMMRPPQQQQQQQQRAMPPQQMPPAQPQPQQPQQQSLRQIIMSMPAEQAKNTLGERLYTNINTTHPSEAAKVTGMLLEMENNEIMELIDNGQLLEAKVREALEVLSRHQQN